MYSLKSTAAFNSKNTKNNDFTLFKQFHLHFDLSKKKHTHIFPIYVLNETNDSASGGAEILCYTLQEEKHTVGSRWFTQSGDIAAQHASEGVGRGKLTVQPPVSVFINFS